MNWTGGKLQRHSGAKENPIRKAQKQHFAKARLQREHVHTSPFEIPTFALPHTTRSHDKASHSCKPSERGTYIAHADDLLDCKPPLHSPFQTKPPSTFEEVRKNLLRNPDWSNLSAVRPVHMTFSSAEEMAMVGKRRKITHEDRVRQQREHRSRPSLVNVRDRQMKRLPSVAPKVSIRHGSKIHQTNPSSSHTSPKAQSSSQATSSETMLLDKSTEHEHSSDERQFPMPVANSNTNIESQSIGEHMGLPTLEKFLDRETFDEVKARSDSFSASIQDHSHSTYPSSPPLPHRSRADWGSVHDVRPRSLTEGIADIRSNADPIKSRGRDPMTEESHLDRWHPPPDWNTSRPPFTFEKQLEEERSRYLETKSPQSSTALKCTPVRQLGSTYGMEPTLGPQKATRHGKRTECMAELESFSYFKSPSVPRSGLISSKRPHSVLASSETGPANDTEDWMETALRDELDQINDAFQFALPQEKFFPQPKRRRIDKAESSEELTWTTGRGPRTPKTIHTSANTTIHTALNTYEKHPVETDFLSQLSPMEGLLDDRLGDISVYNNPARTDRSVISAPYSRPRVMNPEPLRDTTFSSSLLSTSLSPTSTNHRTLLLPSSTPSQVFPTTQFSHYFSIPQRSTHRQALSSSSPLRGPILSNETSPSVTDPTQLLISKNSSSSITGPRTSHRHPLQNIHTASSNALVVKNAPSPTGSGSSTRGAVNGGPSLTSSHRFKMPTTRRIPWENAIGHSSGVYGTVSD